MRPSRIDGRKILVVATLASSLPNLRAELLDGLRSRGYEVLTLAGNRNDATEGYLKERGISFSTYPVQRTGLSPRADFRTFLALIKRIRRAGVGTVLAYTPKPVIWGGLACRLLPGVTFHALITGLGRQFDPSTGLRAAMVSTLYRWSLRGASSVIFQNAEDQSDFERMGLVDPANSHRVSGSGVPLHRFGFQDLPDGPPVFLLLTRLLRAKGVEEFAQAAALLRSEYPEARFLIAGDSESGPDCISPAELRQWHSDGAIEYLGATHGHSGVGDVLRQCHVFVLPSYYGEGVPRTILEAMAIGRPVITTDHRGCRDPIEPSVNGWLTTARDSRALADTMKAALDNRKRWVSMGRAARKTMEERFDACDVASAIVQLIDSENKP